ncbi:hypothetical protein [Janthinobacterium sp. P210006]|uniref:hypothetical protein n=1 Tax=Janthinobacterium sp. P210006 TaxID=3112939 RepID=UPI002E268E97|nr:hypothetical protein [Janthinobacterium sp. P210006]
MKVISKLNDRRINAMNVQIEMDAGQYVDIAKKIIVNNEFQRRRVKNSGTIYSLLKADILAGCLIPPIVLASRRDEHPKIEQINESFFTDHIFPNTSQIIILDGLQRTHSLIELFDDLENKAALANYQIRVEIYLNITEVGILYRMLTLNAGQTPMSLRHQIEILYSNFAGKKIGQLNIIRQIDESPKRSHHDYNYSDLIEGYNSFLERNEDSIDRYSLLDIVQSIGKINNDHSDENSFTKFAETHHGFVDHLQRISHDWEYPDVSEIAPEYQINGLPFGATPYKIFNKPQALTGFGAAIGSLIDQNVLLNIADLNRVIGNFKLADSNSDFLHINKCIDEIKQEAKKIGNAQRMFFKYFFRNLFDSSQSEYYLKFKAATDQAKRRTLSNM